MILFLMPKYFLYLSHDTINFSTVAVHCRDPPKTVFDQTLAHIYHKGDIAKLEILMTYGGIYLDTDVLVLRSMDQLRKHPLTLGREIPPKLIAGIIVAHKRCVVFKIVVSMITSDLILHLVNTCDAQYSGPI